MRAGLGLDELEGGADGVGGGVGGPAQQSVGLAHLHQHGAEVVALLQGGAAVLLAHFAAAELHHPGNHLVHAGVCGGVDDLGLADIEAVFPGGGVDLVRIAHQDDVHQVLLDEARGGLLDAGVGALGKDDGASVGLQIVQKSGKHGLLPPYVCIFAGGTRTDGFIIHQLPPGLNGELRFFP